MLGGYASPSPGTFPQLVPRVHDFTGDGVKAFRINLMPSCFGAGY